MADAWSPDQYEKFKAERSQPFHDLLSLVSGPVGEAVDAGCGTGELTAFLHSRLGCARTVGFDQSPAMIRKALAHKAPGLEFRQERVEEFAPSEPVDVVFSNAALQWVPDHGALFRRLVTWLRPGGQLAVQMPANHDHPSHGVAGEVAARPEFARELGGHVRVFPVLAPEQYSRLLYDLGLVDIHVRLQVYGHVLPNRDAVVEWTRGTLLTDYESRMSAESFQRYVRAYAQELARRLPDDRPFYYPFKRVLFRARRPS